MKTPIPPPDLQGAIGRLAASKDPAKLQAIFAVAPLVKGAYEPWDKVMRLQPPAGLTSEEWWLGIKIARRQVAKPTPLLDLEGAPFTYCTLDPALRLLHEIDQLAGGSVQVGEVVMAPGARDRYIMSSLIEESITSSQLEGASTTVEVAKNMLRSGRKPTDRSEQMILNNFLAMRRVRELVGKPLTPDAVFELHRIVTSDTLDDPEKAGRFRQDGDAVVVEDETGTVLHVPPPAKELPKRLEVMCRFANDRPDDTFIHPVLRAIILHFWVGYDHPFVDGNGRTARALFYWAMLSQNYWLAEYVSISKILNSAPGQYGRSFLYAETDENDLAYFLDYHLRVLRRSIDDLRQYLAKKVEEIREIETLLRESADLNHRQLALLGHALRHPGARYTIESHRRSHDVAYQTARTDLLDLAERGLIRMWRQGKAYQFAAPQDLRGQLREEGR